MKTFGGEALFLDRSDINTDEIIPAKYLTEMDKEALGPHLLEDLKIEGFCVNGPWRGKARVVVSRSNFGCGSSREHAVWAFEVNNINCVIAESFARIFRQNMFNCGMLAIELKRAVIDELFTIAKTGSASCSVDLDSKNLTFTWENGSKKLPFSLTEFDETLVRAGGWVEFADARY